MATYDALDRTVRVKEGILIGLTKTFEESRVAEVRDTPLLTVVDVATPPDRPVQRPELWGGIASGVGLLLGLTAVVFATLSDRRGQPPLSRRIAADGPIRVAS
jgi:uncharacterized protein involved in exopolysaccharide biosynthesis